MAAENTSDVEILIVEDDRIIGLLQKKVMLTQKLDLPVLNFENGRSAMDHLENSRDSVRFLILLDINMPVMNGWEFLEALQTKTEVERFMVAMVTSSINQFDKAKALNFPQVIGYYEKPFFIENARELMEREAVKTFLSSPVV